MSLVFLSFQKVDLDHDLFTERRFLVDAGIATLTLNIETEDP